MQSAAALPAGPCVSRPHRCSRSSRPTAGASSSGWRRSTWAGRPPRAPAAPPGARGRCRRSPAGRSRVRAAPPRLSAHPHTAVSLPPARRFAGLRPNRLHPSTERSPMRVAPRRMQSARAVGACSGARSYPRFVPTSRIAPAPAGDRVRREQDVEAFLERAEVRDVLAWMRLLVDPQDAAAVVRALARPPIDLRQVDLARVIQVARRRKLDLVSGLTAATESPQVPPWARERILRFAERHRSSASDLDSVPGDVFVARLIERLGVRGRPLLAPEQAAEQQASLEQLRELAAEFVRSKPGSTPREMARHLAALVGGGHPENLAGGWSGAPT